MTGPEHYREAEDLLNQPWQDETHARLFVAQALVHATLALAAATALAYPEGGTIGAHNHGAWLTAAGGVS